MKQENIYEFFDIDKSAGEDEIKKVYRKKSKKVHPDLGGNQEDFEKVNQYYKLLISPKLRKIYDETGQIKEKKDVTFNFMDTIIRIFEETLFKSINKDHSNYAIKDFRKDDIILKMKSNIQKEINEFKEQKEVAINSNVGIKEILKRIKSKNENIFENLLKEKIKVNEFAFIELKEKIENHNKALSFLKDYNYEVDNDFGISSSSMFFSISGTTGGTF